jgi:hypothetical protein
MDRGFYSQDNINGLYRDHIKFLLGAKLSFVFVKKILMLSMMISVRS